MVIEKEEFTLAGHGMPHTPSIAFRWHLPPNSARNGYATEGGLFISAQLSAGGVSALLKSLGINKTGNDSASKHACTYEARPPQVKKKIKRFKRFVLFVLV